MYKYPIELQDEEKACGAYCIAMILKYYHFHDEIKNIKKRCHCGSFHSDSAFFIGNCSAAYPKSPGMAEKTNQR